MNPQIRMPWAYSRVSVGYPAGRAAGRDRRIHRPARSRWGLIAVAVMLALAAAAGGIVLTLPRSTGVVRASRGGNPFAGIQLYVYPHSDAAVAASADARSDPAAARLLRKIASQPTGAWVGGWTPASQVAGMVRTVLQDAAARNMVPLLVLYAFPYHGCGGSTDAGTAYERWVGQVAAGIGTARAVAIVEPDALAQYIRMGCLTPAGQSYRLALIRRAVDQLAGLPATSVYLDAGNSGWQSPEAMAPLLTAAGVGAARGFSLNVSNFYSTAAEEAYGDRLSSLLHGKHFVIDTSRNGNATAKTWCNPPGQALGVPPTSRTADPRVDALLWVKAPGSSDGTCNGGPPAGTFWPAYAVSLATNAHW